MSSLDASDSKVSNCFHYYSLCQSHIVAADMDKDLINFIVQKHIVFEAYMYNFCMYIKQSMGSAIK